jgi:hypothetical protein
MIMVRPWLCALVFVSTVSAESLILQESVTVRDDTEASAVRLAVQDLMTDLERVLQRPPRPVSAKEPAQIVVTIDPALDAAEKWVRSVDRDRLTIAGSDALGAVFGIYAFCRDELGVDPMWFWKEVPPAPQREIRIPHGQLTSSTPIFRYRGWFINDEDLLTEWREPGGPRFIRYPFYQQVISVEVADRIYEALLRSGGNLVIPASFVDVMNPPEAALVRRAAERGLYVTQHHIEALGVSHFGFENYWRKRSINRPFNYGRAPEAVREVWRAFAARWVELAGDRVIWQLGLRGKGDTAIWNSDPSIRRVEAGRFITRAIAEQWQIVCAVDPRPTPPATATLWLEGSQLMSEGALDFPPDVTVVFADQGRSQQMNRDFHQTERRGDRTYGVYYHVGFWASGPHLLQGTQPGRVKAVFDQVIAKGDTHYAIVNVCNVREHVLGIQACMAAMQGPWDADAWLHAWCPPALYPLYRDLLDSFLPLGKDRILQDGELFLILRRYVKALDAGKPLADGRSAEQLSDTINKLTDIIERYPAVELPPRLRNFHDVHLLTQARMWRSLLRCLRALKQAGADPAAIVAAQSALDEFLRVRRRAARGSWEHWYRGDKKVNVPVLRNQVQSLREKLEKETVSSKQ